MEKDSRNNNIGEKMTKHSKMLQIIILIHNECEKPLLAKTNEVPMNSAGNDKKLNYQRTKNVGFIFST